MPSKKISKTPPVDPVRSAVARVAGAQRSDRAVDPAAVAEARNALLAARLERAVADALSPRKAGYRPLADADRARIATILWPSPAAAAPTDNEESA